MLKTKFHVFTNLAISFDGKISTVGRELFPLGTKFDHHMMDVHRQRANAVLMGAGTLRAYKNAVTVRKLRRGYMHPVNIVLTANPDFNPAWPFFKEPHVKRILMVPRSVPAAKLAPFEGSCEILRYRTLASCPGELITLLKKRGHKNLLLEGGGGTIFPFVKKDLVDEWNVTVTPKIVGGANAPTMVDGEGFAARDIKRYRLKKCLRKGDELYLQYVRR
jgi:5-amino-6-(5-phosphoribosylamino)uracil reductase